MNRIVEKALDTTQHRLHNCGPVSREVFRTPAIGALMTFDVRRVLLGWAEGREGFDLATEWPADVERAPAALLARVAREAIRELRMEPPPEEDGSDADHARRGLAALVAGLRKKGRFRRLVGIAFHAVRTDEGCEVPGRKPSTVRLATTLAVHAVYAPPLLLWTRNPSLRWMRADTLIMLRCFDAPAASGRRT